MNRISVIIIGAAMAAAGADMHRTANEMNRSLEGPAVPAYLPDEEVLCGLLPNTAEENRQIDERCRRVSGGTNFNLIQYTNRSYYWTYGGEFAEWVQERQTILRNIGYEKLLPFRISEANNIRWNIINQAHNDCATFGFTRAYYGTLTYNIALESGQYYKDFNPLFLYRNTSGGSGGRTLSEILNFNFAKGQAAVAVVGEYPSFSGSDKDAPQRCCNAVRLENTEQAAECLKAGIGVYIGNSTAVSGSKQNTAGLRLAVIGGSWSHSTAFIGYVNVNGSDYFLWRNSHGARYNADDKFLTPRDCCWFDKSGFQKMMASCHSYGGSFAILPKSIESSAGQTETIEPKQRSDFTSAAVCPVSPAAEPVSCTAGQNTITTEHCPSGQCSACTDGTCGTPVRRSYRRWR